MRLTDLQLQRLKPPARGQKTYFDNLQKGFGIRVSVGGSKTFVLMHGKTRKLESIGRYPDLALADARKKAKERLGEVVRHAGDQHHSIAFSDARERFLEDVKMRTKTSTHTEYKRLLEKHFNFTKPLHAVSRSEIMEVIERLNSIPGTASHAFMALKALMNWAVSRGLIPANNLPRMRFPVQARSRVLANQELRVVWERAEDIGQPYGAIIKLLILTGQRRGEIAGLRRSWIKDGWITYPQGFTKNKREHRVPLGRLAQAIIDGLPSDNDLLFPARGKEASPFNGWSKSKAHFDKPLGLSDYTIHDLRRTYSSQLAALGTPIHVTEKLLNHVSGALSGVAGVYNRYSYAAEMRTAVEAYEAHMLKLAGLAKQLPPC